MKRVLRWFVSSAVLALLATWSTPALRAGSADSKVGVARFGDRAIRDLALQVNDVLDAKKVNVAIIARAGLPRSKLPRGISYTHVAFVVFEPVKGADGTVFHTYTVYNLYQGAEANEDHGYLKQDLTYDFVAGVYERDIAICVPIELVQRRLLQVIRSPAYAGLFRSDYNLLTNPWVDRYDNCVSHTLKICMAAIYETDDRSRIYDNIRAYFRPTRVRLGPIQALGSNFVRGVSRNDRDPSGWQTATYDSLLVFLKENGLVEDAFSVVMAEPRDP